MSFNVPAYLRTINQWHHWRLVPEPGGKGRKLPLCVNNGQFAKSNDPGTWTSLSVAVDGLRDDRQLAFTIGKKGTLIGFDFDDCFDENGDLLPWAGELLEIIKPFAYAEHSPSGDGIKALVFGQKPEGCSSRFDMGNGSKLEVFDNTRFWTWTGDVIFDNLPDAKTETPKPVAEYLSQFVRSKSSVADRVAIAMEAKQPSSVSRARAEGYAAKLEVMEGSRNNTAYHLTHKARSFGCTEADARSVVVGWNASLAQPLSQAELSATFSSAWAGSPYEPAEDRPLEQNDHSGLTHEERREIWAEKRKADASKRAPVDYSSVIDGSGFVELIVGLALTKTEEQHPEYGLSAAMTLLSLCAGRRYYTKMRHTTNGNTYIATIGHSGSGKESVRDVVAEFIDMAGLTPMLPRCENVQGYKQLAVWVASHPNAHLMLDEYAESMQRMTGNNASQSLSTLAATLKSAYTQSGKHWNPSAAFGENGVGVIQCPSVNINATMTPGGFEGCITEQAVETGLLGRFMVFCAETRPDVIKEVPDDLPTSDQFIESNRDAFDIACSRFEAMVGPLGHHAIVAPDRDQLSQDAQSIGQYLETMNYPVDHDELKFFLGKVAARNSGVDSVDRVEVEVMPDAEERLSTHFNDIATRNRDERGSITKHVQTVVWTRAPEKTAKFALLFALSRYLVDHDAELRVELQDAERAISLNNKLARRLTALIEDSAATEHSKLVEKIVGFIDHSANKTATYARIISFTKSASPRERDDAIKDAVNSGLIELRKDGKGYTTDLTD